MIAAKSGLVSFVLSLPTLPRETFFCLVDGFSRIMGMTTLGVDMVLAHPNNAVRNSPWAMVLIAFLSGGGGGMIVPAFRMFGPEWGFTATPGFIKAGLPIDVWSAGFIGYVYALSPSSQLSTRVHADTAPLHSTLIDAHPFFRKPVAYALTHVPALRQVLDVPKAYLSSPRHTVLLQPAEAKT